MSQKARAGASRRLLKVFFDERFGVRLEGRGYWVDLPSGAGGDFTQTEASAGLILKL